MRLLEWRSLDLEQFAIHGTIDITVIRRYFPRSRTKTRPWSVRTNNVDAYVGKMDIIYCHYVMGLLNDVASTLNNLPFLARWTVLKHTCGIYRHRPDYMTSQTEGRELNRNGPWRWNGTNMHEMYLLGFSRRSGTIGYLVITDTCEYTPIILITAGIVWKISRFSLLENIHHISFSCLACERNCNFMLESTKFALNPNLQVSDII